MKTVFEKIIILLSFTLFFNCSDNKEPEIVAPNVNITATKEKAEITYTSVKITGEVSSNDDNKIISRGVCWSINEDPKITNNKTTEKNNTFEGKIENLKANTKYYFRVYAENNNGVYYSEIKSFNTRSLAGTKWDFTINYVGKNKVKWNADVTFNEDGTTVYDEPESPGAYLTKGTWSLEGNNLTYNFDSEDPNRSDMIFKGVISEKTMSGTWSYGKATTWSAIEY